MLSISPQRRVVESTKSVVSGSGFAHSRSTSAGSYTSNGHDLEEVLAETSLYPTDTLGLPDYDYPTSWSLAHEHSAPLVVKNTFLHTNVQRPESLEGFYQERQIQSCPASGIALPSCLDHSAEPDEAAAKLGSALGSNVELTETPDSEYMLQTPECSPLLLSAVPLGFETPSFLLHALQNMPGFHIDAQLPVMPSPLCPPCVLDLASLCPPPQPAQQAPVSPEVPSELDLGSPQCPTLGSKGHWFGKCKPCAFLHTRGCGNGVLCPFCHLCDPGEKKRRAKDKRAAVRCFKQSARQHF